MDATAPATPRRLWLARHASRLDLADPAWARGAARPWDPPLSPRGRREAAALARRLAREPLAAVHASGFARCVETALPLARGRRLPIRIDAGLGEWLNPAWFPAPPVPDDALRWAQRHPEVDAGWASRGEARYGERGEEALQRAGDTVRALLAAQPDRALLVVGHGASVLGALAALLGIAPEAAHAQLGEPGYAALWCLEATADRGWRLRLRNDDRHLADLA